MRVAILLSLLVLSPAGPVAAASCVSTDDEAGPPRLNHPASGPITSPFGLRRDPVKGHFTSHTGIDYEGAKGDPVRAAASGEVVFSGVQGGYGLVVVIRHSDLGMETLYAHLAEATVAAGQCVFRGQMIGAMGQSGIATGVRLHFELHKTIDPTPLLFAREP